MHPMFMMWGVAFYQILVAEAYERHIRHWIRRQNADPEKWHDHVVMITDFWGPQAVMPPYYYYKYPQLLNVRREP